MPFNASYTAGLFAVAIGSFAARAIPRLAARTWNDIKQVNFDTRQFAS
jgi:hypothetical protein